MFEGADQIGGPLKISRREVTFREFAGAKFGEDSLDQELSLRRGCGCEGERSRSESKLKQAVAGARLQVIITLGKGFRDQPNLGVVETKTAIGLRLRRLECPRVWQEYPGWA